MKRRLQSCKCDTKYDNIRKFTTYQIIQQLEPFQNHTIIYQFYTNFSFWGINTVNQNSLTIKLCSKNCRRVHLTCIIEPCHEKTNILPQRLCFRYLDSTIPLLPKFEISSLKPSSVAVQPGLCLTRSETRTLVFS